tara:strand:- start:1153 stop:1326 length:174 start_codon:yes stop_codon:yes gene_type:complete
MSLDPIIIKNLKKKITENQSEELANEIINYLKKKELNQLNTEEKIKLTENILDKIKL